MLFMWSYHRFIPGIFFWKFSKNSFLFFSYQHSTTQRYTRRTSAKVEPILTQRRNRTVEIRRTLPTNWNALRKTRGEFIPASRSTALWDMRWCRWCPRRSLVRTCALWLDWGTHQWWPWRSLPLCRTSKFTILFTFYLFYTWESTPRNRTIKKNSMDQSWVPGSFKIPEG